MYALLRPSFHTFVLVLSEGGVCLDSTFSLVTQRYQNEHLCVRIAGSGRDMFWTVWRYNNTGIPSVNSAFADIFFKRNSLALTTTLPPFSTLSSPLTPPSSTFRYIYSLNSYLHTTSQKPKQTKTKTKTKEQAKHTHKTHTNPSQNKLEHNRTGQNRPETQRTRIVK